MALISFHMLLGVLKLLANFTGKQLFEFLFNKDISLCGTSECFMKALKAFLKSFEAPQRPAAFLKWDPNTGVFL